jgi:VIT family
VTTAAAPGAAARKESRRVLDPTERFSEILFGLIMVLTFTGSLSAAQSGRAEVRTMLIGALGCNLAWGIIDAVFYLMNVLGYRGHAVVLLRRLRHDTDPGSARALIAEALPPRLASALKPEDFDLLRQRLAALPEPPRYARLHPDDWRGAVGVFLLVFLSTFPVAIPFLVMHDATAALRVSNAVAIALLFVGGYKLATFAGFHRWGTGLAMVAIGLVLVGLTIALGG